MTAVGAGVTTWTSSADRPKRAVMLRREMLTNTCERETDEANIDEDNICVYLHTGT